MINTLSVPKNHYLDDTLLEKYIHNFYGYGNYEGKYWLIGMEEGGGENSHEIDIRLQVWNNGNCKELEDVAKFHQDAGLDKYFFCDKPKLQRTWAKLIRLILSAECKPADNESIRNFQGSFLGREGGNNCILELLPLPNKSIKDWIYSSCTKIDYLQTRDAYKEKILSSRIAHLKQQIAKYASKPKIVVFYSRQYEKKWQQIAGCKFESVYSGLDIGVDGRTVYAIMRHPASTGVTNAYFETAGKILAERLKKIQ